MVVPRSTSCSVTESIESLMPITSECYYVAPNWPAKWLTKQGTSLHALTFKSDNVVFVSIE